MSDHRRYRKRPVVIEAMQYRPDLCNCDEVAEFMGFALEHGGRRQAVEEAIQRARRGLPWRPGRVLQGVRKPDIFAATYEEAPDE